MQKNTTGQKWRVFAFTRADSAPVTGGAANITCKVSSDYAAAIALADANPTEVEDGYYYFDLTPAETNYDVLEIYPESSVGGVQVIGVPGFIRPSVALEIKAKTDLITSSGVSVVPTITGSGTTLGVRTYVGERYAFTLPTIDYSSKTLRVVWEADGSNVDVAEVLDGSITKTTTSLTFNIPNLGIVPRKLTYSVRDTLDGDRVLVGGRWLLAHASLAD